MSDIEDAAGNILRHLIQVQEKRLELSWYCYHTDLNRARLPIPPFLRDNLYITPKNIKCQSPGGKDAF